jgi:starch-binding outer membrane protein, SusD/RagB family
MRKILVFTFIFTIALVYSCGERFLDKQPLGVVSEAGLQNAKGADALLIAAYSSLDGFSGWGNGGPWQGAASNWVFGSICGADAYKGSDPGDQAPITPIERISKLVGECYMTVFPALIMLYVQ